MRASRARPPARDSHHTHRPDDDNTSNEFSNKLNNYNSLSLKLHIGFCCCHHAPNARGAADAREARAVETGRVHLRHPDVKSRLAGVKVAHRTGSAQDYSKTQDSAHGR